MNMHPCEFEGCQTPVAFDDEPYCFIHSADSGSHFSGFSYSEQHQEKVKTPLEVAHEIINEKKLTPDEIADEVCENCNIKASRPWVRFYAELIQSSGLKIVKAK